jgi:pimeloyl-ACP methyl ester carboxylesterase
VTAFISEPDLGGLYKSNPDMSDCAMQIRTSLILTLTLFATVTALSAQQIPAIAQDPPPDKEFPASTEAPDIPSHGARLNAIFYLASGRGPNPVVVLMHGLPGNEQNMDLAYAIRRDAWNVLVPHYRGPWGSQGTCSFANSLQDTQPAIQFLREAENAKKYRIDSKRIVLIGHSMGGFMVAYAAANDSQILGVAMISAWNVGASMVRTSAKELLPTFAAAVPRLAGTTSDGLVAEARQNSENWDYLKFVQALKGRPVLITEAIDRHVGDNKAMAEALRKAGDPSVSESEMQTDHSYADHRIALQVTVIKWLENSFAQRIQ